MYSLIYSSNATIENDRYELLSLLTHAKNNNEESEITGMLLYAEKKFLQVIEGEKKSVLSLYKKIKTDSRHYKVRVLKQSEIEKRMFSDWTMGYKNIEPAEFRNIPGLTGFMEDDIVSEPYELLLHFKDDSSCFD